MNCDPHISSLQRCLKTVTLLQCNSFTDTHSFFETTEGKVYNPMCDAVQQNAPNLMPCSSRFK